VKIAELLDRMQEVCPLPAAAQRVAQLCADDGARIEQIAEVVATDPSLAAVTMRIANSAAYGRAHLVTSLEEAVVLIGLAELQRMAMAMALLAAFHSTDELTFNFHDRSVLAGSIARAVAAKEGRPARGEAFLCGLLCEIGAMACAAVDSAEYHKIWDRTRSTPELRAKLEVERYSATSPHIGAELLRRTGLPAVIADAIEANPAAPTSTPLGRLTAFARFASRVVLQAAREHDQAVMVARFAEQRETFQLATPAEELVEICVQAAAVAVNAIRKAR
jgi:HD-like signal output (HDOD) protein